MSKPERIDASELEYHKVVVEGLQDAEAAQQEAARLQQVARTGLAVYQAWAKYLIAKYELAEGEGVDELGNIVRGEK